jgi:uncharacterized protein DUF3309
MSELPIWTATIVGVGFARDCPGRSEMSLLLLIVLILLISSLPTWPYSTAWGYYPSGGLGIILLILLILLLVRRPV